MKTRNLFFYLVLFVFCFVIVASAEAILWPPHRVGGTVTANSGSLDGCIAVISSGGSESVSDGAYMFNVPIYDADDNPDGTPVGSTVTVSIKKDGETLASESFVVEAGGTTRIDFVVDVGSEQFSLTTSVNGQGSVSPSSGTYDDGESVTITAIPASGWSFDHWGGDLSGTNATTSIVMNSNKSITAYFTEIPPPPVKIVKLCFPHIACSKYWKTEVALINDSTESLRGVLNAYNQTGSKMSFKDIFLSAHGRKQILVSQEFNSAEDIAYLIFESESGQIKGYTKFWVDGVYRVAVPAVREFNEDDVYIPHIASSDEWWTGIALVNTNSYSKLLTIIFDDGRSLEVSLSAHEQRAFSVASLFGQSQPDLSSAVIKNAKGVIGVELFGSNGTSKQLSGVLLKSKLESDIYYPHLTYSYQHWWTGIVAYSPKKDCELTIHRYCADGYAFPLIKEDIKAGEKFVSSADVLSYLADEGIEWMHIHSSTPLTGFELFGSEDGKQLAGYTSVGIASKKGIFPKLEKNGWTGIAFINIKPKPNTVVLKAYDDDGCLVAVKSLQLKAFQKQVDTADNFFSEDISEATYIAYSAEEEIVGFQLNGTGDSMLDALPGM